MNKVFLDTSYILALELANDRNHIKTKKHWQQLGKNLPQIVTTTYIFDEIVTYFNSRNHHAKEVLVGNSLLQSAFMEIIYVDRQLFDAGWQYFQKYQDKQYSLTDCISFIVMNRENITLAFSLDKHFSQAGFTKQP